MPGHLILGTRGSALALVQAHWMVDRIERLGWEVTLRVIRTAGDRIADRAFIPADGRGVFVADIEQALLEGAIDVALHSLKDLPADMHPGLAIAAVPVRADPRDVLVGRVAPTLATLPPGAILGTSSLRRRAQLTAMRPDLAIVDMRGNVDSRLRKLDAGDYDAICLAAAGLLRLNLAARITEYLDLVLPAPGQGALALQARADDYPLLDELSILIHDETDRAVRAERAVLAAIGGGCRVPLGALATIDDDMLTLVAVLGADDGSLLREEITATGDPEAIGRCLAERLLALADATA